MSKLRSANIVVTARLSGVSPTLDGMKVQVITSEDLQPSHRIKASQIYQVVWFAGELVSEGTMFVLGRCLMPDVEPPPEPDLDTANPYGKFVKEGSWSDGRNRLAWAEYESAFTVTITNEPSGHTLFSDVFYGTAAAGAAEDSIVRMQGTPGLEPVDFMFEAKRIKEIIADGPQG